MSDAPAADASPFEEQRQIYDLLSQETRHLILQYILAHPQHLPSLAELDYLIPKNKSAIRDQLHTLIGENILAQYDHSPNKKSRDLPAQFFGLTEYGVEVLEEYNYLSGLPLARAVYDNTRLSTKAQRHQEAPRPDLPEAVEAALRIEETPDSPDFEPLSQYVRERKHNTHSVDDQITLIKAFWNAEITPDSDGIKRTEIGDRLDINLDHQARTVLNHLVEIDLLTETAPPGPDVLAISEHRDEIVNGNVTEEANENIEALVAHIDDEIQPISLDERAAEMDGPDSSVSTPSLALADGAGRTVRSILAQTFGIAPEHVEEYLQDGDPVERLNAAVDAIEAADEISKSEDYGRIAFVRPAYRYRLSEKATDLV